MTWSLWLYQAHVVQARRKSLHATYAPQPHGCARRYERGHAQRPGPVGEPLGGRIHAVQQQQRLQHQERAGQHARQLRAAAAPRPCIGLM